jgi:hypothetical protein
MRISPRFANNSEIDSMSRSYQRVHAWIWLRCAAHRVSLYGKARRSTWYYLVYFFASDEPGAITKSVHMSRNT